MPAAATARAIRPAPQLPRHLQVEGRLLKPGHPLRVALEMLQLKAVPPSLEALRGHVEQLHPRPERSWTWDHAQSYRALFDLIAQGIGSSARARGTHG